MKRKVALLSALLLTAVAGFTGNIFGDANGDGRVDMADVVAVVNAAMGNAPDNFDEAMADINGNGKIDEEDASLLAESLLNPPFDRTKALEDDYERAFTQDYLPMKYSARYRKQQITSQEFKALLKPLIEKFRPGSMDYFNEYITEYDAPLTRGMATCMVYYVARSIGVETSNKLADRMPDDFWAIPEGAYQEVLPHAYDPGEDDYPEGMYWRSDTFGGLSTAWMWNHLHCSDYSNEEIVAMDREAYSYRWNDVFIWEDAVRAITRLYDSLEPAAPKAEYISITDSRVLTPENSIISPVLIARAAQKEIHNIADMPRHYGFQTGETQAPYTKTFTQFDIKPWDIEDIASWGFNSVRYLLPYWALFSSDMTQANITTLRKLDGLIAAALEYGIHFQLSMTELPGRGKWLQDDPTLPYILDNDILNPEKRSQARLLWNTIATRYKEVPNVSLSFMPVEQLSILFEPEGFGEGDVFTREQVVDFLDLLIDAIREISPERFIYYEDFYGTSADEQKSEVEMELYQHISKKYNNTQLVSNHMDGCYAFYNYPLGDGNIDYASHSAWMPYYPICQYNVMGNLGEDHNQLFFDGFLPRGTQLEFHLRSATNAEFTIAADGTNLYSENISGEFKLGFANCSGEPLRPSEKVVQVTLTEDANEVVVSSGSGWVDLSGINVILPDEYGIEKWRRDSQWDVDLGILAPEDYHSEFYKKKTSTIQIGFTYGSHSASRVTIHDNLTYTTSELAAYSDASFYDNLLKRFTGVYPRWACKFEDINSTDYDSSLRFWDDTMAAFKKYNADVWCSSQNHLMEPYPYHAPYHVAGYEGERFRRHRNFNVKLLRVLQKYIDK